jgi:RecB family exonuclease
MQSIHHLESLVKSLKLSDPLAPVTVIGPSTYANLSLRHNLGRSGLANVRFLVLPRLAELLGAPSLAAADRRPLTSILESAAVRSVSANASGILESLGEHPSTHRSLKSTFRQLRFASPEGLKRLAQISPLRRQLVELHRKFLEHTSGYYDREDLARAAAAAVNNGTASGLADLGLIVFFQLRDISPGERTMVQALALVGQCSVICGVTGDPEVDAPTQVLTDSLSGALGEPEVPTAPGPASHTRLLIAPDPHQEIRWVIRHLVSQAEAGMPFHRMAVLYRKSDPYGTLVRQELELAGVPVAGPNPVSLADTGVGRALTGLVQLSDGRLDREAVANWLTGCPVGAGKDVPRDLSPSQWDAISRAAGIVRGLDQWTARLGRYAGELERLSQRGEDLGEMAGARADRMRTEAVAARGLLSFIEGLAVRVTPPAEGSPWRDWSRWARNLLDYYLVPEGHLPDAELTALEGIRDLLDELGGLDDMGPGTTGPVFLLALTEALQGTLGHLGTTGQGVFVAPAGTAAAMDFDLLHLVGMIEGAFPPRMSDDPLLPDRDREAAGGPDAGLPLQRSRQSEERYAFLSALATAPRRVLSFPRSDPAAQRAHYPSRWFLEQASLLEGTPVFTSSLGSLGGRSWITVIASMEQALATVADCTAADDHDYRMERLWRWKQAGRRVRSHPLVTGGPLAQVLTLARERQSSRLGPWDGDVSTLADASGRIPGLGRTVFSPTRLERWANCPFSYFLGNVLGIGSLDRPEEVYSMTALEKGSLVHHILERFLRRVSQAGTIPGPQEAWSEAHRQTLLGVARDSFIEAEARGISGRKLMWQLDQADILSDLDSFLLEDTLQRAKFGVSPHLVETRFGLGPDSWPEAVLPLDDGQVLRFRGIIDRVDIDPSGKRVLVMDYKTGSSSHYGGLKKDPVDRGRRLQLPVYSLAAQRALGEDVEISAAYWFVTSRGKFALMPPQPVALKDAGAPFRQAVSTIASGIQAGLFPANPGEAVQGGFQNCTYCDFNSLCPSRREVFWDRKKGDHRLAAYLKLSGPEMSGPGTAGEDS